MTAQPATATKGIVWFLILAFGGAWGMWEAAIRLGVPVGSALFQLAVLPGAFAPAIAAFIVRKWITREGFQDAGLKLAPGKWPYYLVAWFLPLIVMAAIVCQAESLSLGKPDFSLMTALKGLAAGRKLPANLPADLSVLVVLQLMITAIVTTPLLFGEEFGWRGYLQRRLFPGRPLAAALATGPIWGVWHWPLILRGYDFPDHPLIGALLFPVTTTLLSIIFGWLRERSGSIWVPSLAHAATNAVGGSLSLLWFYGGASPIFISYVGILGWTPLAALCLVLFLIGQLKPRPSAQTSDSR